MYFLKYLSCIITVYLIIAFQKIMQQFWNLIIYCNTCLDHLCGILVNRKILLSTAWMSTKAISHVGISKICHQDLQSLSDAVIIVRYFLLISLRLKYVGFRETEIISTNILDVFIRMADSYLYMCFGLQERL